MKFVIPVFLVLLVNLIYSEVLHLNAHVKTRDGIELNMEYYFSASQLLKKNPVVLIRTPYGTKYSTTTLEHFNKNGYITVVQDIRGMHSSKGYFSYFRFSGVDGEDTIKWIKEQKWCDGNIFTFGFSANGITQLYLNTINVQKEVDDPKAQCIGVAAPVGYQQFAFTNGAYRLSLNEGWLKAIGHSDYVKTVKENEQYSDFWDSIDLRNKSDNLRVPSIHIGGGTVDGFKMFRKNTINNTYLVMNVGGHCQDSIITFPEGQELLQKSPEYCTSFFKDKILPVKKMTFYMPNLGMNGSTSDKGNFWTSLDDWPETKTRVYYLSKDELVDDVPADSKMSYVYNPRSPTPTLGGNNLMIPCGPLIQNTNEKRDDNLVFSSKPFEEEVAIFGEVTVNLEVSSNCTDTDFVCRLTDVDEKGNSFLVSDTILRMKWRDSETEMKLMIPDERYTIKMKFWTIGMIFSPFHSIRLSCTSSNYPRYSANGNSGKKLIDETELDYLNAKNTIYIGENSFMTLPVVSLNELLENKL